MKAFFARATLWFFLLTIASVVFPFHASAADIACAEKGITYTISKTHNQNILVTINFSGDSLNTPNGTSLMVKTFRSTDWAAAAQHNTGWLPLMTNGQIQYFYTPSEAQALQADAMDSSKDWSVFPYIYKNNLVNYCLLGPNFEASFFAALEKAAPTNPEMSCGEVYSTEALQCGCKSSDGTDKLPETLDNGQICCGWKTAEEADLCAAQSPAPPATDPNAPVTCGNVFYNSSFSRPTNSCTGCNGKDWEFLRNENGSVYCCGWVSDAESDQCASTDPNAAQPPPANPPPPVAPPPNQGAPGTGPGSNNPAAPPAGTNPNTTAPGLNIFEGPTSESFAALNPLAIFESDYADQFSSPAGIINRALLFVFPLAGLILFVMIVWGGFEMIYGATNSKSMQAGKQRITAAIIGFMLLFASFWIIQIVEYIFNLAIL